MKRILSILLTALLLFGLTGCNSKNTTITDTYLHTAQNFIAAKDYDAAITTLKEGLSATQDESIAAALCDAYQQCAQHYVDAHDIESAVSILKEGISVTQDPALSDMLSEIEVPDFAAYAGYWTSKDFQWEVGALVMLITVDEENQLLLYCLKEDDTGAAIVSQTYNISELCGSVYHADFKNDGFGNSGTMEVRLKGGTVTCSFQNMTIADAEHGFSEKEYTLVKNEHFWDEMPGDPPLYYFTGLDYDDMYAEIDDAKKQAQTYIEQEDYQAAIDILETAMFDIGDTEGYDILTDAYLQYAQSLVDQNQMQQAKEVLERGYNSTFDPKITDYLSELSASSIDFTNYIGDWYDAESGLNMNIDIKDDVMTVSLISVGYYWEVAEAELKIKLSNATSPILTANMNSDGWGHSGKVDIAFDNPIQVTIYDIQSEDDTANWGLYAGSYTLYPN